MRTLNRCTLLALAAGLTAAQRAEAQVQPAQPAQGQPRTHTVVRGDNLWDLSQTYLGNPVLWPEIYRLNRDVVEDPHWIFPGEILRLPGPDTTQVPNVAQLPDSMRVEPPVSPQIPVQAPVDTAAPTVFTRRYATSPVTGQPTRTPGEGVAINVAEKPTVRLGEVIAAPYVDREGGPRGFGRILKSGDLTGVAQASDRFRFQSYDKIFIAPPVGYVAPEGERYLAIRLGPVLEDQGQIVIPTGIVEVTSAARSGLAATAKVVRSYAGVEATDRLIPIDTSGAGTTIRPQRVSDGPTTTIRWISGEPVLPSVQSFVVLGTSARNGVRMGDEFTVYLPRKKAEDDRTPDDPEILISKMQVVRSTPYGVTAVIVGQEQPAIREGMSARITAKMP